MAEIEPIWLQAGEYVGDEDRLLISALLAADHWSGSEDLGGVTTYDSLKVAQNGTPNMSVNVTAGLAIVKGTEATGQGYYVGGNDATVNKAIAAADNTNPRRDIVCLRIRDSQYSGSDDDGPIFVVTGTPAAVPVDPAIPVNAIPLARVAVAAGATSITNANITDLRVASPVWTRPRGFVTMSNKTADQTLSTSGDISNTTVSFEAKKGRRYRLSVDSRLYASTSGTTIFFHLRTALNADVHVRAYTLASGDQTGVSFSTVINQASDATLSYKLFATAASGFQVLAGAVYPTFIEVEDIGGFL